MRPDGTGDKYYRKQQKNTTAQHPQEADAPSLTLSHYAGIIATVLACGSHAAMLVDLGCSILAVDERLGDTVEVAMGTYSHLYPDKKQGMADDLEQRARGEAPEDLGGTASLDNVSERLEQAEKGPL